MKRVLMTGVAAAILGLVGMVSTATAANPEPLGISMLRIEMKKTLMQQEAAPKMTQLRQKKLQEAQAAGKTDDAADAEVELIQAQTTEAATNINAKQLDLQLKESLKSLQQQPPLGAPGSQPGAPGDMGAQQEPSASPAEISMLQYDLQKVKLQADAASRIAQNRQKLLAAAQARIEKGLPPQAAGDTSLADLEADALATQTSARMVALDVEAAQLRLDAAVKSTQKK